MSRAMNMQPAPMSSQEYTRRYADACVKADVAPGPGLPYDDAAGAEDVRDVSQDAGDAGGGDGAGMRE